MTAESPPFSGAWTPLALAADIPPATSAGTVCDGVEIVVWRDDAGAVHAWEDRCPHRGMKLSFGFVRGDRIACLYHGWEFDGGGGCRYIPAHPDLEVPASIRVTRYRAAEALGMIWAAPVDGAGDPPAGAAPGVPLRSLQVDVAHDVLARGFAAQGLPGLGPVQVARRDGAIVEVAQAGLRLWGGIQPVDPGASVLHLMVDGAGDDRAALVPATAALRRMLENEVLGVA